MRNKFEIYLSENGYESTGAPIFSTSVPGGLYRYYNKDDKCIIYGLFKHGNPPHVWIPQELINIDFRDVKSENKYYPVDIEDIMIKIEGRISHDMKSLFCGNLIFNYNIATDKIHVTECKPVDKLSLPGAIVFVMAAKKQEVEIIV